MESKVVPLKSHQVLRGLMDRYYQEAKEARGKGQPIAWCSGVAPTDLLSAMGFFVLFPENHAALCGSRKVSVDLCEESE
ncbi:MAG: 2-hydroxyacyl-CoA dehydratase, partial [Chloroflexota bacterium]|nr:2-hydroxyacyl-CoA dehydratase [Chloroflexota bacterium]